MTTRTDITTVSPIDPAPATPLTCGHELPTPHDVCENCKRHACEECAEDWVVCECCGGGICEPCSHTARARLVSNGSRREFLCGGCAAKQDKARAVLNRVLGIAQSLQRLTEITKEADETLAGCDTDERRADYPRQAGWLSGGMRYVRIIASAGSEHADPWAGQWLDEMVSDLKQAVSEAKEAL